MSSRNPVLVGVLALFLGVSALIQYQAHQFRKDLTVPGGTHPLTNKLAPSFSLEDETGQQVRLEDFRGSVVILDFWATWCGPCRRTFPVLEQLQKEKADLVVLAINLKETPEEVEQYLREEGFKARVLFDSDGAVGTAYQVQSIPTQVLIDRNGKIQAVEVGFSPLTFRGFRAKLEATLKR